MISNGNISIRSNQEIRKIRTNMFKGNTTYVHTSRKLKTEKKIELSPSKKKDISKWARSYNKIEIAKDITLFLLVLIGTVLLMSYVF